MPKTHHFIMLTMRGDDETPLDELEANVRALEKPGLVWGQSSLEDSAFGVKKLRINLVVEDELVSIEDLRAEIEEEDADHVQSTDIVAMSKV
jgi:elongation factor 1-beta